MRVLDNYQDVIFVGCHHDLVLRASKPQERKTIRLVQRPHDAVRLEAELADERRIGVRVLLAEVGPYWDPVVVQDKHPFDSPVRLDSLQCLLHLGRHRSATSRSFGLFGPLVSLSAKCFERPSG